MKRRYDNHVYIIVVTRSANLRVVGSPPLKLTPAKIFFLIPCRCIPITLAIVSSVMQNCAFLSVEFFLCFVFALYSVCLETRRCAKW